MCVSWNGYKYRYNFQSDITDYMNIICANIVNSLYIYIFIMAVIFIQYDNIGLMLFISNKLYLHTIFNSNL